MAFTSGSTKDLLKEYHRLAADTLLGERSTSDNAVLSAAEDGQLERLRFLLTHSPSSINARCPSSGDTPLILAARAGHKEVVHLLLKLGTDVTAQNDADENALEVASDEMKKIILSSIEHEDRAMTTAQALLQSAWLGDAVSVKKSLESGKSYINVDCRNSDGMTPLLLVTRDLSLFEKVQSAMEQHYDPVTVMQELINNHADVNACNKKGQSALHLVASCQSVHARKMVSLLMCSGSAVEPMDEDALSPLHVASSKGHTAIIVALVEKGGADVNLRGGEMGETPLMLTARGGHNEATRYLISKGADVNAIDENGDTALNLAKTPSMVRILKEAWIQQPQSDPAHSHSPLPSPSCSPDQLSGHTSSEEEQELLQSPLQPPEIIFTGPNRTSLSLDNINKMDLDLNLTSPQLEDKEKFFLTEGRVSRSAVELEDLIYPDFFTKVETQSKQTLLYSRWVWHMVHIHVVACGYVQDVVWMFTSHIDCPPVSTTLSLAVSPAVSPMGSHTPFSEAEADDELDGDPGSWRVKPATRRAHNRGLLSKKAAQDRELKDSHATRPPLTADRDHSQCITVQNEAMGYSSADEGPRNHSQQPVRPVKTQASSRDDGGLLKKLITHRPSKLTLSKEKYSTLSRSFECLTRETKVTGKQQTAPMLPQVIKSPLSSHSKNNSQQDKRQSPQGVRHEPVHLPYLSNMKAVALMAVDADRDKLRVQKFVGKRDGKKDLKQMNVGVASPKSARASSEKQDSPSSIQRSQSLMNFKKESKDTPSLFDDPAYKKKKRFSTGSIAANIKQENKVPLLPNIVTSEFGVGIQGVSAKSGGVTSNHITEKSKGHGQGGKKPSNAPKGKLAPKLSILDEYFENCHSEKGLNSASGSQLSSGSKDSTLKSGDFETDSLEKNSTPTATPTFMARTNHHQGDNLLPPLPPHSNLVISYANPHSTTPLSPIWNQNQYLRTDSETSTSSDYITSYIGKLTSLPTVLSPDFKNQMFPGDSVHGESSDSDHGGSSGESGGEGVGGEGDGCLKWKRGRLLGKGAYGKVWEGLLKSARMIAVKELELDTDSLERAQSQYVKIQAEVAILRSLKHRNIVSYLGTSMHMATIYIFMQYISGGTLQSLIKRFGSLDGHQVSLYTRQITQALCYIHGNGIIHRDIKGANIMVNSRGVVKLIDFGCAKNCQDMAGSMHSVRGTPYWMAPEVICGQGYGMKSDIWSLGCTVLEMATTKPPWADYPPEAAMFQIGMGNPIPPLPDHLDKTLTDFFYLCLTREQNNRPGASELLEHKFLDISGT